VGIGPCRSTGPVGERSLTFLSIGHTSTLGWLRLDPTKRKGATCWGGEFHRLFLSSPLYRAVNDDPLARSFQSLGAIYKMRQRKLQAMLGNFQRLIALNPLCE